MNLLKMERINLERIIKGGLAAAAAALTISILPGACILAEASRTPDHDIIIVHTNDVHCGVDENIGYAGVKLYEKELQAVTPYVTLVDAGDAVQGEPMGTLSNGEYIVDIMNKMGYDVIIPGNHEYDYGMKQFMHLAYLQNTDYVSSNFQDAKGNLVFAPYKMETYGDTRIAFVGVTTPETMTKSNPKTFMDSNNQYIYSFGENNGGADLYARVQKAVDEARADRADYVFLVAHMGENYVTKEYDAASLLSHLTGVDLMIDGHSHELIEEELPLADGTMVPVAQTGTKLKTIGWVNVHTDGTITTGLVDKVPQPDERLNLAYLTTDKGTYQDVAMAKYIEKLQSKMEVTLSKKIGSTSFTLPATDENGYWLVRNQETNLTDFMSDAFRAAGETDIAFCSGGSVRATLQPGDLTYKDAISVLPFNNMLCKVSMTGAQIQDFLEASAQKYPDQFGGFQHPSGLTYTLNSQIPTSVVKNEKGVVTGISGKRRVSNILVDGAPLDLNKTYTVTMIDYYAKNGGDGLTPPDTLHVLEDDFANAADAFADYIKAAGGSIPAEYQNAGGQGRITIK